MTQFFVYGGLAPAQQWCTQTQPHPPHIWTNQHNMYASCGGHS